LSTKLRHRAFACEVYTATKFGRRVAPDAIVVGGGATVAATGAGTDVERNSSGIDASCTRAPTSEAIASVVLVKSESDAIVSSTFEMGDRSGA